MLLITSWREREEPGCLRLNRLGRIQASIPFPIGTSGSHAQTPFTCTATHRDFPLRQPAAPRHGADGSSMWLELCGWNYLWLDPCFYREPLGIASFFLSTTAFFTDTKPGTNVLGPARMIRSLSMIFCRSVPRHRLCFFWGFAAVSTCPLPSVERALLRV